MGKQRQSWSVEEKLATVLAVLNGRQSVAEVARQRGVNENQVYRWKEHFLDAGRQGLNGARAQPADQRLEAENTQLKKLLDEKALGIEILKKLSKRLSIKGFMRLVGQPYWRLRDYLQGGAVRKRRIQVQSRAATAVAEVAGAQPTYGYRRVYQRLRQQGRLIGRERVRRWMGALGLQPPVPLKKNPPTHPVVAECHWPEGRRLQIDATRFRLDDGVAWVYWGSSQNLPERAR